MTEIVIRRGDGWRDRWRAYRVLIDGQDAGQIRRNSETHLPVVPGLHSVKLKIDWEGSQELMISVQAGARVLLECNPNSNWRTGTVDAYISLTVVDSSVRVMSTDEEAAGRALSYPVVHPLSSESSRGQQADAGNFSSALNPERMRIGQIPAAAGIKPEDVAATMEHGSGLVVLTMLIHPSGQGWIAISTFRTPGAFIKGQWRFEGGSVHMKWPPLPGFEGGQDAEMRLPANDFRFSQSVLPEGFIQTPNKPNN